MTLEGLLPVLSYMAASLDEDLSLPALAERAGITPWHFQRVFTKLLGETPKQHVLRLRLEQAALRLRLEEDEVIEVGLACGFASHTVFGRAFRRRFGMTPTAWRAVGRLPGTVSRQGGLEQRLTGCAISSTRLRRLGSTTVAWIRHTGPYEEVPPTLWDELLAWSDGRYGPLLGVALDAPGITAAEDLRFDACLVVPPGTAASGRVGVRTLGGGTFAVTTHIGPFATLPDAYRVLFDRLLARADLSIIGLPTIERYLAARLTTGDAVHQTEICVPVRTREGE
jgi:AraC family transcriptional regulator